MAKINYEESAGYNPAKKYLVGIVSAVALIFMLYLLAEMFVNVDQTEIVVLQAPTSGKLTVYGTSPGTNGFCWQGMGKITRYKKSYQYWFSNAPKDGDKDDQSIKIRFNDGGHAQISGSIRVDMPLDDPSIIALHIKYGSQLAIEHALIGQLVIKSVYMSGPMMSSTESYAERRNDLISIIEGQIINGIYKTYVTQAKVKDLLNNNEERVVNVSQIRTDETGNPVVQEVSPAKTMHIRLYQLAINDIAYDKDVEAQIKLQRDAIISVQTARSNSAKAEQDAYTAEQMGKASAAKEEWAQKTANAKIIAEAEGRKLAAQQDAQAAAAEKTANILRGEGEGAYKRAITTANNNLTEKLAAYVTVQEKWADAFSKFSGNLVPTYQSGGGQGNNATNWIEIMGMKAMRDLNLDANPSKSKP